jgi:H+/Cl- antiporter ClcA
VSARKPENPEERGGLERDLSRLGDFTATARVVPLGLLAIAIGALSSYVAAALLKLIALCTNLFFFQRLSLAAVTPADAHLGVWGVLVPIAGALLIGWMARYGSDRIRGHGIPEALEAILIRGSRIEPKVALLKPISSALSIGSGGPFGAEGPIIMTGGAFGSLIAQFFHLTSAERKTLLVAGAAAGMSATFATPIAAVLIAVELLLFEWKPRSFVPVALASATAALFRSFVLGPGPLFHVPQHAAFVGPLGLLGCVLVGLAAGALAALMTKSVYASEDLFQRLPIHWMWWPALGGLAIGLGGLVEPHALGVGYDRIEALLGGSVPWREVLALLLVKWAIWALALGSGTSGGVLAPILILGGSLGALAAHVLPDEGAGFWALVSMGAVLGGTMRSPLTGVLFLFELTNDASALLPLLVAVTVAHVTTVLGLKRSILTEKVARRGYHVTREYAIDPLEVLFVHEVMSTSFTTFDSALHADKALSRVEHDDAVRVQRLYPILDASGELLGVVTAGALRAEVRRRGGGAQPELAAIARAHPVLAYADESLRTVVYRMADSGHGRLLVVERANPRRVLGLVTLSHLLRARTRHLEEERRHEGALPLPFRAKAETHAGPRERSRV